MQNRTKINMGDNIRKLMFTLTALFVALSSGLVYWQVVVASQVTTNVHNSRNCLLENSPVRGTIYDRNGMKLAYSVPDANAICGYTRHYADSSLAGLIGYYVPGYPFTGLEKAYDDILSGRSGLGALDNTINHTLHRSPVGNNIYLTIDDRIQQLANQHFDDSSFIDNQMNFATDRGSIVISEPKTGAVLSMVSRPGFDPNKLVQTLQNHDLSYYNQLNHDAEQPLLERPLWGQYVPGSIYKTVTLLAGLDSGKTTLDQPFSEQQARGPVYFNSHPIGPDGNNIDGYTFHFPVTTAYGFAHSDNVIYAQVGVNTGLSTWLDYNKRFYVGQQIPFDLPSAVSTVLPAGQTQMSDVELASDAFGQGTDFVTPFQMSLIDNIVANNGQLMKPMLVSKITDFTNTPVQTNDPQSLGSQQVSNQTATQTRQAMYGVTYCGSGSLQHVGLNLSPWGIIGKTGTAQLNQTTPAHGWMLTQAPYSAENPSQLPALTIVAMKENSGEGGSAVGPMISSIYNDIFSHNYVQAQHSPFPPHGYCQQTGLLQY